MINCEWTQCNKTKSQKYFLLFWPCGWQINKIGGIILQFECNIYPNQGVQSSTKIKINKECLVTLRMDKLGWWYLRTCP